MRRSSHARIVLTSVLFPILAGVSVAQSTWWVDASGTPPGSGTQGDPYTSIQAAIAAAGTLSGDTINVLPGTYVENLDYLGKDLFVKSTAGPGSTTLDGNLSGSTVSFVNGETSAAVLRGFKVTNGSGTLDSTFTFVDGGGIYVVGSSPTIENCDIADNSPNGEADRGGGVFVEGGAPTFDRCSISGSRVSGGAGLGGGAYCDGTGTVLFDDCDIRDNFANRGGGIHAAGPVEMTGGSIRNNVSIVDSSGIYAVDSLDLTETTLRGNFCTDGNGGGVYFAGTVLTMVDCLVFDNTLDNDHRGGGVYVESGSASVQGGCFSGNEAASGGAVRIDGGSLIAEGVEFLDNLALVVLMQGSGDGGAVFASAGTTVELSRCIFAGNEARGFIGTGNGGAVWGAASVDHCTLVANRASMDGGAVWDATVSNSILWDNELLLGTPDELGGTATATWSDVEGGAAGTGNIDALPLFWSHFARDFQLRAGSPCIDTADPTAPTDPDGSRADMGALPYDPTHVSPPFTYCTGKTGSEGCIPFLEAAGSGLPSTTGTDPFIVRGNDFTRSNAGILVYGFKKASLDFHGGKLCVKSPTRTAGKAAKTKAASACTAVSSTGRLTTDFNLRIQSGQDPMLTGGQDVFVQWQQRDPANTIGGFADTLSNGMRFTIEP